MRSVDDRSQCPNVEIHPDAPMNTVTQLYPEPEPEPCHARTAVVEQRHTDGPHRSKLDHQRLYFGEFSAEMRGGLCTGIFRGYEPIALSDMPRKVLSIL